MNILFWVLQVLMSLHTLMGAIWKLSNSTEAMPSLAMIPPPVWMGLSILEIPCAILLILPFFYKRSAPWLPKAAIFISLEMILFSALHLISGANEMGPVIYWMVVAVISGFIAYGRSRILPINTSEAPIK